MLCHSSDMVTVCVVLDKVDAALVHPVTTQRLLELIGIFNIFGKRDYDNGIDIWNEEKMCTLLKHPGQRDPEKGPLWSCSFPNQK